MLVVLRLVAAWAVSVAVVSVAVPAGVSAQEPAPVPFGDVLEDAFFYEPVRALAEMGVFEGTECEEGFCPERPLLRGEMAVWLIRALGEDSDLTDSDSRFADVDDSWYVPHIERMADLEITAGCGTDPPRFCPDRSVSRSEMASFLARALDLPPAPSADFTDVDYETNVHSKNIDRLAASEITVGCRTEPLRYCPSRSTSRAHMATFIYRALEWRTENESPRIIEDENPGVFLTEENEISRFFKHEIVDKYADEHPWLMEVWNYTNRQGFEYTAGDFGNWFHQGYSYDQEESLYRIDGIGIETDGCPRNYYCPGNLLHEVAHAYTLSNEIASQPAPLAAAMLYFEDLSGDRCAGWELYADAAAELVFPEIYGVQPYWSNCSHLPSIPTSEAVEIVRGAFGGEMPEWFYDTFQMPDGRLDYRAIWSAIEEINKWELRASVAYQLKDEFGGYCPNQPLSAAIVSGDSELIIQPWRNGGCP